MARMKDLYQSGQEIMLNLDFDLVELDGGTVRFMKDGEPIKRAENMTAGFIWLVQTYGGGI